jgi:C4-type Zn-finger protein
MPINLHEYQQLKSSLDRMQKESDRAEGALQQLKKQMKDEFGCSTIKEAKALVSDLDQQEKTTSKQYEQELLKVKEMLEPHINVDD